MADDPAQASSRQVADLLDAMLGSISWNFRAVWIDDSVSDQITLHFFLAADDPDDREEISDIVFEFEARQDDPLAIEVECEVHVSSEPWKELPQLGYLVYARAE